MNELEAVPASPLVMRDDFRASSKISINNSFYNNGSLPSKFKVKAYCPLVFRDLRERFEENPRAFLESWVSGSAETMVQTISRRQVNVYTSYDKRLTMTELRRDEVAQFHNIFQQYHAYIVENRGVTTLPRYLGLYRVTIKDTDTYLMVTNNVLSCTVAMDRLYDLKGSDREASEKEKEKEAPILKDTDFRARGERLHLGAAARSSFTETVARDVDFLAKCKLMDYSLAIGIHKYEDEPPAIDDTRDVYAIGAPGSHRELYFLGIVDVLTKYGTKKTIASKVQKMGTKGEVTTVNPEQYSTRFLKLIQDITE